MHIPPFSNPTTSFDAALSIVDRAEALREQVWTFIAGCEEFGATDFEIQTALDLEGNTERPRRWELANTNRIVNSGRRRLSPTGRQSIVWVLPDYMGEQQ